MMHYGIIRNKLGEWITYARGESSAKVWKEMDELISAGFPAERIKVVTGLDPQHYIGYNHMELTMKDGSVKEYELHSMNKAQDFVVYIQMAMTKTIKDVVGITLTDPCHNALFSWTDERPALLAKKETPMEVLRFLQGVDASQFDYMRRHMAKRCD